jgi:hypothetical protein
MSAPAALAVNTWTHVAATYDGAQMRLFINGAPVAALAQTGTYEQNANPLWIGGNALYGEHFQGLIDDLRIYNRALSATEIQADMNSPVGSLVNRPPTLVNPGNQTGAVASPVLLSIVASDLDSNPLTYSATPLPGGLTINSTTGVISGTDDGWLRTYHPGLDGQATTSEYQSTTPPAAPLVLIRCRQGPVRLAPDGTRRPAQRYQYKVRSSTAPFHGFISERDIHLVGARFCATVKG